MAVDASVAVNGDDQIFHRLKHGFVEGQNLKVTAVFGGLGLNKGETLAGFVQRVQNRLRPGLNKHGAQLGLAGKFIDNHVPEQHLHPAFFGGGDASGYLAFMGDGKNGKLIAQKFA